MTWLGEALHRIGLPSVVSLPAFILTFVAGLFGNLVAGDPGVTFAQRLLIVGAAQLALWVPLWLMAAFFLGDPRRSRPVVVLVGVAMAVVLRAACISWLTAALVDPDLARFGFRLVGNFANQGIVLLGAAYVVAIVHERRAQMAELAALRAHLQESVDAVGTVMEARNEEAVERVRNVLASELDRLASGTADDALTLLQHTATEVVRPLSHELALALPSEQEPRHPPARVGWTQTIGDVESGRPFLPTVTAALLGIEVLAAVSTNAGGLFIAPLVVVLVGLLLTLANRLLPPLLRGREVAARLLLVAGAALLVSVLTSLGILVWSSATGFGADHRGLVLTLAGVAAPYVFAFALAVSVAAAILRAQRLTVLELAASTEQLKRILVRRRQAQWLQQKSLSRALHGPVQAAVTAAAIRLDASIRAGDVTEGALADLRDELLASLDVLGTTPMPNDWEQGLERIVGTWDGICVIDVEVSVEARQTLEGDAALRSCVVDILTEVVSNAVRHGGAGWLVLAVGRDDGERTLRVTVAGDAAGSGPADPHSAGLGTQLLDDCTISWTRDSEASSQRFAATLPLS